MRFRGCVPPAYRVKRGRPTLFEEIGCWEEIGLRSHFLLKEIFQNAQLYSCTRDLTGKKYGRCVLKPQIFVGYNLFFNCRRLWKLVSQSLDFWITLVCVPHPIHLNAAMKKPYVRKRLNYSERIRFISRNSKNQSKFVNFLRQFSRKMCTLPQ